VRGHFGRSLVLADPDHGRLLPFRPWNVANQSTGDDKNASKGQKRNASLIGGGATIQGLVENY